MEVVCAQLGFTGKQPILPQPQSSKKYFNGGNFRGEEKRKCRHQTYYHKPAVEKGWGRDTPIETSLWFLFICLTTTSLFSQPPLFFHGYFFRWQTERNNYFFKYHLIKTLISRIIDVFERVIFYFKDFTVNLHSKGSGEEYGCTRVVDPSWPNYLLYTDKETVSRDFCFRFFPWIILPQAPGITGVVNNLIPAGGAPWLKSKISWHWSFKHWRQ